MNQYILLAVMSIMIGVVLTGVFRWIARKIQFVNKPNKIVVQHRESVAYLGGLAVFLSFLISHYIFDTLESLDVNLILGAGLYMLLGLVDDAIEFKPLHKFLLQLVIAVVIVSLGLRYQFTGITLLDSLCSGLWFLIMVNAFNLIDVCDGLTTGVTIVSLAVGLLCSSLPLSAFILLFSLVGFFLLNKPNASIYLGDSGSHLLGFSIAYYQLSMPLTGELSYISFLPLIFLSFLPIYELCFLIIVRRSKGLKWWNGSPDHLALRLQKIGWTKWQTLGIAIMIAVICTLPFVAYIFALSSLLVITSYSVVIITIIFFTRYLLRA